MAELKLVYGPDPIFRQKATPVAKVDAGVGQIISDMFDILYAERGLGLGANMVGLLLQIIVIDLQEGGKKTPLALVNPAIQRASTVTQSYQEASLSFPGIVAEITRPKQITVAYLDKTGAPQILQAEGFLATVIQHEMDYLEGRTFLDHLSRTRRQALMRKAAKHKKQRDKN